MYGVFLFGHLSEDVEILNFMRESVSKDENWRVQEVLAKAFDEFCKRTGFEKSLPVIDSWLQDKNPNTRRLENMELKAIFQGKSRRSNSKIS